MWCLRGVAHGIDFGSTRTDERKNGSAEEVGVCPMSVKLLNFSIVVLGEAHNPSILNPDFLSRREIVPDAWGWEIAPPVLSTPPFAQVRYTNGLCIVVEPAKLQVRDEGADPDPLTSRLREVASRYVRELPHVPYKAVGVNFAGAFRIDDPATILKDRFLQPGPWNSADHPLTTIGYRFVYPIEGGRLRLSLEHGEIQEMAADGTTSKETAIIVDANFHRQCAEDASLDDLLGIFELIPDYWSIYQKTSHDVLEG
jgi:hypothetical protein